MVTKFFFKYQNRSISTFLGGYSLSLLNFSTLQSWLFVGFHNHMSFPLPSLCSAMLLAKKRDTGSLTMFVNSAALAVHQYGHLWSLCSSMYQILTLTICNYFIHALLWSFALDNYLPWIIKSYLYYHYSFLYLNFRNNQYNIVDKSEPKFKWVFEIYTQFALDEPLSLTLL